MMRARSVTTTPVCVGKRIAELHLRSIGPISRSIMSRAEIATRAWLFRFYRSSTECVVDNPLVGSLNGRLHPQALVTISAAPRDATVGVRYVLAM